VVGIGICAFAYRLTAIITGVLTICRLVGFKRLVTSIVTFVILVFVGTFAHLLGTHVALVVAVFICVYTQLISKESSSRYRNASNHYKHYDNLNDSHISSSAGLTC
jgi:hypothetical protein